MSDKEREEEQPESAAVDPPANQPGGNMSLNRTEDEAVAVDPPANQPGGGR